MLKLKKILSSRAFNNFLFVIVLVSWYLSNHIKGPEKSVMDLLDGSTGGIEYVSVTGKNDSGSLILLEYTLEDSQFSEILDLVEQMSIRKLAPSDVAPEEINYNILSLNFENSYLCLTFLNENIVYISGAGADNNGDYMITGGPDFSIFSIYYTGMNLR